MKVIDIKDANTLANKIVNRINDNDAQTMKLMAITFATKLFVADPKTYNQYVTLDGELDLMKLAGGNND